MSERVAIVGSRDWPDRSAVIAAVDGLADDDVVVSGGARGVDTTAARAAQRRGLRVIVHPADWKNLGKRAGYVRNADIVNEADRVIAFQYNGSKGTQHTIDLARKAGKPVELHSEDTWAWEPWPDRLALLLWLLWLFDEIVPEGELHG